MDADTADQQNSTQAQTGAAATSHATAGADASVEPEGSEPGGREIVAIDVPDDDGAAAEAEAAGGSPSDLVVPPLEAGSLTFVLHDIGGVTPGSQAEAGFQRAAAIWQSFIGDAVTIRLDVGFSALGAGILGSTGSNSKVVSYSTVRSALIADQSSSDDAIAVANLSAGASLSFFTNNTSGARVLDNNGSGNNTYLDVNTANLKALGITTDANGQAVDTGAADGSITFSSSFTWDFDPSNGITAGAIDFVGVAFHEIGHALGFVSGVDAVDYYSGSGPGAPLDLNPYAVFNTLDLFRYSSAGVRDLSYGGATYFSINGGATSLAPFSTGRYQGDGRQASHWKDNLGIGIMDPTSVPAGQANVVTARDIQAMDVIGWNRISASNGSIVVSDASISEGDSGTKTLTFTVTRTGGTAAFSVGYATADGTARVTDGDYVSAAGVLQFAANENSKTISITINGDTRLEANETFVVNLSGATNNVSIADSQATGTITNDDPNHAPALTASNAIVSRGQVVAMSSLVSATDPDGQQLSYWFRDNTIGGGRFEFDGVAQAEGQTFGVADYQLSRLTFRAGSYGASDSITVNAWDGLASSNVAAFSISVPPNAAPALSASSIALNRGQVASAASLFSASDANGDELSYWFRDNTVGGGRFEFDGIAQPEGQSFGVSQSQLSHLTFRAGGPGTTDSIQINAWDGSASSSVASINVNVAPNVAPTVTASNTTVTHGKVMSATSLFGAGDANGDELSYWFRDNTVGGGHFEFDGIAQAEGQLFGVSQSQLSHLTFRAGASGTDSISVNTWDGLASSGVATFNIAVAPNSAPTMAAPGATVNHGQAVLAASLFSSTDADGDAVSYWFRDNTIGGGHFEYNGVAQAEGQTFGVSQAQLSRLTFRAGNSGSDSISVNAWDGQASSSVVDFNVQVAANHAPTLTAADIAASRNQLISAASLFTASDPDGDQLSYWFRDNTPGGGRFEYDGIAQPEGQTFGVSQAQLSHLNFHTSATAGPESITVNAWDGLAQSTIFSFQILVV